VAEREAPAAVAGQDEPREELASRADLVQSLEQGRTANPRLSTLRGLASALGVTLGELVGEVAAGAVDGEAAAHDAW
jgi:transcriptional regulator with XRE-family HTH domain